MRIWKTSRRDLDYDERPLVMAILNVTPDSFSDGGVILNVDAAVRTAEKFIDEGADILDIGGESTRPGSTRVTLDEETRRVVPVIEAIAKRFDISVSVDTSKAGVAARAIDAGAEIVNDISGLRFDERIAEVAARTTAGLVLMHSRGEFENMHSQQPVQVIFAEVASDFRRAISVAEAHGVARESIALDIGIGFGKTAEQNLELIAKLDKLTAEFQSYPIVVGTSRKSFIGKLLNGAPITERLTGSLVTAMIAVWKGANILRVHDVKETVNSIRVITAVRDQL
jgi:dihydropteroate synthase